MSSQREALICNGLTDIKPTLHGMIKIDAALLDYFGKNEKMKKIQRQTIESNVDPMDKLSALWNYIEADPCERYNILIHALKETGQDRIVRKLEEKIPTEKISGMDKIVAGDDRSRGAAPAARTYAPHPMQYAPEADGADFHFTGITRASDDLIVNVIDDNVKYYPMGNKPRGFCVIINFKTYRRYKEKRGDCDRHGSDADVGNLKQVFEDLYFDTKVWNDQEIQGSTQTQALKWENVRVGLEKLKGQIPKDHDMFVMVVMSHGFKDHIEDGHSNDINIDKEIVAMFEGDKCPPDLANKPKVFFIQACQEKQLEPVLEKDSRRVDPVAEKGDILVVHSTSPGFPAWRDPHTGSWFIEHLCKTLHDEAHNTNLANMVTHLCGKVSKEEANIKEKGKCEETIYTQLIYQKGVLLKELYFLPGYNKALPRGQLQQSQQLLASKMPSVPANKLKVDNQPQPMATGRASRVRTDEQDIKEIAEQIHSFFTDNVSKLKSVRGLDISGRVLDFFEEYGVFTEEDISELRKHKASVRGTEVMESSKKLSDPNLILLCHALVVTNQGHQLGSLVPSIKRFDVATLKAKSKSLN